MSDLSELTTEGDDATHGPNDVNTEPTGLTARPPATPRKPTSHAPFDFSLKLDLQATSLRDRVRARVESSVAPAPKPDIAPAAVADTTPSITDEWSASDPTHIEPFAHLEPVQIELFVTEQAAAVEAPEQVLDLSSIPQMVPVDAVMPAMVTTPDMRDSFFVSRAALPVLPKPVARQTSEETSNVEPRMAPGLRLPLQPTPVAATSRSDDRKPRLWKKALVLVIILGLLGGAGYVLLQKRSESQAKVWPSEVAPLATFVESTLGHSFNHAVPISSLPQAEYEAKLGIYLLDRVPQDDGGGFSGLRALGLIDSDPSAAEVGQFIGATRVAFYDPTTQTIYRPTGADAVNDAEAEAGILASMSAALFDQFKNWGGALATMSPSQRIGYLSMVEGLGSYVIREKLRDAAFAAAYTTAHSARVARQATVVSMFSPWVVGLFEMPTPTSLALLTRALDGLSLEELNAPTSDAAVLDSARGFQTPVTGPTAELSTVGMYFWYGVLYPALGSDAALSLASAWSGDSVSYTSAAGRDCIRASVATRDAASLAALVGGLNTWALTRPASSSTTVAARGTVAVVNACEPVELAPIDLASKVGVEFHARLSTEQVLLQQLNRLTMPLTAPTIACAVNSYRTDGLGGLDEALPALSVSMTAEVSAELGKTLQDLAGFCSSAR